MKNYFNLVILAMASTLASAQTTNDTIAIKELLIKEGATWRIGNIEEHASCWMVKPYNTVLFSNAEGQVSDLDPDIIINPSKEFIGQGGFSMHSNFTFSIYDQNAWVKHDEISIDTNGKRTYTKEIRFLEKDATNHWKLVGQTGMNYMPTDVKESDTISHIQSVDVYSKKVSSIIDLKGHYEAPNWHRDNYLILNSKGRLKKLDLATKNISEINTGSITSLNNDHGLSPDQKTLVLSNFDKMGSSLSEMISSLYLVPVEGGTPKKVSTDAICFWHGWSPDGKTLAYVGMKGDNLDIYTIPVNGGKAKRLTRTEGLDDGPEYSPDGKYIYINSYRSGHMQLWRMRADGSNPEQLTFDSYSNWFPHISPDNKWIAYISYVTDQKQDHLFGKKVKLRLMNIETREITDLTPVFYGGQGTINVPSWSADSRKVAFVSYSVK